MFRRERSVLTSIKCNTSKEGERIEKKLQRMMANKEGINEGIRLMYTDPREDNPGTDIRTDRFKIAAMARDKVDKERIARRDNKAENADGKKAIENGKLDGTINPGSQSADTTK